MDWELLTLLLPAFAAGILVIATHVPLGQQVLKRGIIFIDLAIAQVAALGSLLVHVSHELEHLPFANLLLPLICALLAASLIAAIEKRQPQKLEALIGCLYVLAAVSALLVVAHDPHGAELIKQLLNGQILWLTWSQLALPAGVSTLVLLAIWQHPQWLSGRAFYPLFALIITLSVELVGVYLVFSCLIMPALAVMAKRKAIVFGYLIGLAAFALGLSCSAWFDLPAGATIVVCLALVSLVANMALNQAQPQPD